MLKLYLLRHAQAAGGYDVDDYQRPLTLRGIEQAQNAAAALPNINLAICSSALRTKMTLDTLQKSEANIQKIVYSDKIYNGSAGGLMAAIQDSNAEDNLLIIAHNPGIHQLANILCAEDNNSMRERLKYDYAPATLSIIACPIDNWKDIKLAENHLTNLIIPE